VTVSELPCTVAKHRVATGIPDIRAVNVDACLAALMGREETLASVTAPASAFLRSDVSPEAIRHRSPCRTMLSPAVIWITHVPRSDRILWAGQKGGRFVQAIFEDLRRNDGQ
jgi:hypothetical protein